MIGQFRGKNVFDGTPASPHNLSSFQKINSQTSIHPESEMRAAAGCSKIRDTFPAKNSWRDVKSIMILSISKLLSDTKVSRNLNYWVTLIYSVLVLHPALQRLALFAVFFYSMPFLKLRLFTPAVAREGILRDRRFSLSFHPCSSLCQQSGRAELSHACGVSNSLWVPRKKCMSIVLQFSSL